MGINSLDSILIITGKGCKTLTPLAERGIRTSDTGYQHGFITFLQHNNTYKRSVYLS
jgi:hypothetical protein